MEGIKEYKTEDLTIGWEPKKCIHAGVCVKMLPQVYDPKAKPWIKQDQATTMELIEQIDKCPSKALTYKINED